MSYWKQPVSKEIFERKYMINGEKSVEEVFQGIAKKISSVEKTHGKRKLYEKEFLDILEKGLFIPAGRILANARPNTRMPYFNNCYTIGIEDHIEKIYDAIKEDAQISRTGGGVGLNFSNLRPRNAPLSKGGVSSGAVSFMKVFNESARIIQVGGSRRSAHMGILNIDHPDIEEFITTKKGSLNNELTQFNISVGITDDFMKAVEADADWNLVFEGKVYKTVKAKYLYDLLARNSFEHNEPGTFNIDNVHREANSHYLYKILQTNPCGEQSLPEYGVCCLGAINLTKFVLDPFSPMARFDMKAFRKVVKTSIRFLDNVLDATEYPLKKIEKRSIDERRIGLGYTGFADMLAMLKIVYGSEGSKSATEKLGQEFRDSAYEASIELAREKGKFKKFSKRILDSGFIKRMPENLKADIKKYGLRNIACLTVAPTGTTALSLGQNCSSGIEPIFSLQYNRTIRIGDKEDTKVETVYDSAWLDYIEFLKESSRDFDPDNIKVPDFFTTTADIDIYDAIDIQAIWQKYIDSSISKTINLPPGITFEEYKDMYKYAYDQGLKGVTSFNPEGSIAGILSTGPVKQEKSEDENHTDKRPKELPCDIHEMTYQGDKYLVIIGMYENRPYEMFVTRNKDKEFDVHKHKTGIVKKVKKGQYSLILENGETVVSIENIVEAFDAIYGSLSRFISMSLRHKVPLQFVVDQLIKDKNFMGFERVVSRVLKKYIREGEKVKVSQVCPECGSDSLMYVEGCKTCSNCNWSKCD